MCVMCVCVCVCRARADALVDAVAARLAGARERVAARGALLRAVEEGRREGIERALAAAAAVEARHGPTLSAADRAACAAVLDAARVEDEVRGCCCA